MCCAQFSLPCSPLHSTYSRSHLVQGLCLTLNYVQTILLYTVVVQGLYLALNYIQPILLYTAVQGLYLALRIQPILLYTVVQGLYLALHF